MPKQIVQIALPIEFSEVVEVVYQDLAGTNGRSLSGSFAQAIVQGGTFNPTYSGSKDRLQNFRGYQNSTLTSIFMASVTGGFLNCQTLDVTRYHDGVGATPVVNDIVYIDIGGASTYNGGNLPYNVGGNKNITINTIGVVTATGLCFPP